MDRSLVLLKVLGVWLGRAAENTFVAGWGEGRDAAQDRMGLRKSVHSLNAVDKDSRAGCPESLVMHPPGTSAPLPVPCSRPKLRCSCWKS